jgi:hypothetical protein
MKISGAAGVAAETDAESWWREQRRRPAEKIYGWQRVSLFIIIIETNGMEI